MLVVPEKMKIYIFQKSRYHKLSLANKRELSFLLNSMNMNITYLVVYEFFPKFSNFNHRIGFTNYSSTLLRG